METKNRKTKMKNLKYVIMSLIISCVCLKAEDIPVFHPGGQGISATQLEWETKYSKLQSNIDNLQMNNENNFSQMSQTIQETQASIAREHQILNDINKECLARENKRLANEHKNLLAQEIKNRNAAHAIKELNKNQQQLFENINQLHNDNIQSIENQSLVNINQQRLNGDQQEINRNQNRTNDAQQEINDQQQMFNSRINQKIEWVEAVNKAIRKHQVIKNMTEEQVIESIGKPNHITAIETESGTVSQWQYGFFTKKILNFDRGILIN